jgi:hypothetical protein
VTNTRPRTAIHRAITATGLGLVMAVLTPPIVQAQPALRGQPDSRQGAHKLPSDQTSLCAAAKLAAGGAYVDDSLECLAKAGAGNEKDSTACLRQAAKKLSETFARYERTGACTTTGEAAAFKAFIDPAIADVAASLGGASPGRCTREKLLAAGEAAGDKYACQAEALSKGPGFGMDLACWAQAGEELIEAFQKAENKGDCAAGTADARTIGARIDALVIKARGVISPAASSCSPVEVKTLHGANFHGNTRLTKIENGTVPCLHVDDGTVAVCRFSAASASGEWLEGPDGAFAKVGQAISLNGAPGGDYIVAARMSDAADVPCVEPTSRDTAGWVAPGTELGMTCTLQEALTGLNALVDVSYERGYFDFALYSLVNNTTREVCSSNNPEVNPHPDGASFVRTTIGRDGKTAYCYTGPGAALNDINGTERDATGSYLNGEQYCHWIVSSGYVAPGSKRPATKSLPAPGIVNTSSPILWRPVNPNINIANDEAAPPAPQTFTDKAAFIAATQAESATGELPDLGFPGGSATVGSVTFNLAPGGDNLAIGAVDTPGFPSWYPDLPGNWIALGHEALQVTFAAPVHAMGFDFVEPNTTMPPFGGTPVDSTYQVTLFNKGTVVGRFTFNAPDDVLAFVGVRTDNPFDRAWIVDVTRDATGHPSPFIVDDEYFGQFYTGGQ